ncbi:MAG: hypothetical protein HQK75_03065 [Candidatus Magnetomorum sp.]|nr:hypothetical protein [Candidatus Magnetomorum sp.]
MSISLYFNEIKAIADKYTETDFVLGSVLHFDIRPGNQGYLKGEITFADKSVLFVKEFLDYYKKINKVMYCYHYQNNINELIFRYDNAQHKPPLKTIDHKHLPNNIVIEATEPDFQDIIIEICTIQDFIHKV